MNALSQDMTQGSVTKKLILFSIPLFLSYLLQALYGSADAMIVGRFSSLGDITGVTQGSQIINILTQGVSGLSTGGSVLIARYAGARQYGHLKQTIQTLFTLFAAAALGLTALMLFCNELLIRFLQVPSEAIVPLRQYLQVCEIGIIFIFFYNCISAVLQALGNSRHPLIFAGIACIVNVLLDLLMVGIFQMGALGAAIATVLAQMLSVILSIRFLRRQSFFFDFAPSSFHLYPDHLKLLLTLGLPYAFMRTVVASSFLAVSGLSNGYGLAAASASGVVSKINNFATMPFSALLTAIATVAGQNLGIGQVKRSKKTLYTGFLLNFSVGSFLFLLTQFFPRQLLGIFSSNREMIDIGINFLRLYTISYLLMPFSYSIHGFMTACGFTWIPSLDGLLASIVFRIPLATLFSQLMGYEGIALGSALAVLGAVIPAACFFLSGIWKKGLKQF